MSAFVATVGAFLFGLSIGALACLAYVLWATRNDDQPKEPWE